jgi:hypothetical protein
VSLVSEQNNSFEVILVNALKIPGVKVNRREFLAQSLAEHIDSRDLSTVIEKGPIEAGISPSKINQIAKNLIEKRTLQSTGASFAAGLPGGLAMAATIPADTMQFFGVALRLSQELAYLFGRKDLWVDDSIDNDRVRSELTLFLGVMFGVAGSASTLKVITAKASTQLLRQLPQKALTKTMYYPIIKKIAAAIGVKITKKSFAQGLSKVLPVLGGIISGGITYASMKPMGSRLRETLFEVANNYTSEDYNNDFNTMKKEMGNIIDVDVEDLEEEGKDTPQPTVNVADELLKYKQLLDMGAITEEEFTEIKYKLLLTL